MKDRYHTASLDDWPEYDPDEEKDRQDALDEVAAKISERDD